MTPSSDWDQRVIADIQWLHAIKYQPPPPSVPTWNAQSQPYNRISCIAGPLSWQRDFLYQIFMPSIYSHINATYLHYLVLVPGSQTIQHIQFVQSVQKTNITIWPSKGRIPKKTDICERLVILFPDINLPEISLIFFLRPPTLCKCYFLGFPNEKFSLVCDKFATD